VLLICVLAFVLRYLYILSLDHLLCQFGDAYFFLAGATKLREFVCNAFQSGNFNLISALPPATPNAVVALGSLSVSDRLMVDGPIFPSYLALVQFIVGLAPGSLLFDGKAVQISIVNALLDSLTCLFVFAGTRCAFDRKAGYIAATLFALYPASIINTQSCYTEPFGCFVLALWSWLILAAFARQPQSPEQPPPAKYARLLLYLTLGIVTGILALTRPPFIFLPCGFAALLIALRFWHRAAAVKPGLRLLWPVLPLLVGLFAVLLPWMAINQKVTGHYSIFVNRLPAFNLYLGNQLHRDGWRAYPFPSDIPETVPATTRQILKQASAEPFAFVSMELRKIPRLWVGTWNEFQYALFGIPVAVQEVLHQVLMGLAVIGLLLLITKGHSLKEKDAAISLTLAIIAVHCMYLAFEPIARYTMTATPAIFMLAGYMIASLSTRANVLAACLVTLTAIIASMHADKAVIAYCATLGAGASIFVGTSAVYAILLTIGYICIHKLLVRADLGSKPFSLALGAAFLFVAALAIVCIVGNPEMSEWKTTLSSPQQAVRQAIVLPPLDQNDQGEAAYLLMDLAQGQCPAPLNISVNDTWFEATPTPWWQIQPNPGFLDVLTLSERAMGVSLCSYRQWWVVPLAPSMIKHGATNTVIVAPASSGSVTVYGDYAASEQSLSRLPSLKLASWTKAFCTYDHYDSRIYETTTTAKVHSAYCSYTGQPTNDWVDDDLSSEAGRQFGQYRIRLVAFPRDAGAKSIDKVQVAASAGSAQSPYPVVSIASEHLVSGGNPYSMQLAATEIKLPAEFQSRSQSRSQLRPLDFQLQCLLASPGASGTAFIGVQFEGKDSAGSTKKWTSIWQPALIRTERKWAPFYLSDSLPEDVLRLHDLRACVTLCPFYPDLLLLHQKQAIRGKVLVKNLTLTLSPGRRESLAPSIRIY
jgi:4-amino-4-deoxy-L-arabinose transferase-like glycosyltransferase